MIVDVCCRSVRGPGHDQNEDSYLIDKGVFCDADHPLASIDLERPSPVVLAISDGMGGLGGGAVASATTLETFRDCLSPQAVTDQGVVAAMVAAANEAVLTKQRAFPSCLGQMGCTLSGLVLGPDGVTVIHIGDSRIYRALDGDVACLTVDQTQAQAMVSAGALSEEEAIAGGLHRRLVNYVGKASIEVNPVYSALVADGSTYLLTSDGLHDLVSSKVIERQLKSTEPLEAIADRLMAQAAGLGLIDDTTLILARVRRTNVNERRAAVGC